jgi:hypothetical protein
MKGSTMSFTPPEDQTILHQADVEAVIDDRLDDYEVTGSSDFVEKVGGTISVPASPGATYTQAEVVALRTAIAAILTKLQASGLID